MQTETKKDAPLTGDPVDRSIMQHTPGPWHVSASGPTVYALHGQPQRNRFSATMQAGRRDDATLLELVANASLMAAAPTLLSVLRRIINSVPFGHSHQAIQREAMELLATLDRDA